MCIAATEKSGAGGGGYSVSDVCLHWIVGGDLGMIGGKDTHTYTRCSMGFSCVGDMET